MNVHPRKLEKLKKRLQQVLNQQDLQNHRAVIQQLGDDMAASTIDCAAALLFIHQPHLFHNPKERDTPKTPLPIFKPPTSRNVRYRLDIGTKHQVMEEELLAVVIEESGVDRKRIGRVDMRDTYTLIDLPDGMPADIFQLLREAKLGDRPLNIKRVKSNRRKFRENKRPSD